MRKISLLLTTWSICFLGWAGRAQTPDPADPFFGQDDHGKAVHVFPTADALERHFGKKPTLAPASKTAAVYPPSYGTGSLIGNGGPEVSNAGFQAIYWNSSVATSTSTSTVTTTHYATIQDQVNGFVTAFPDNVNWDNSSTDDYTIIQQYGTGSTIAPTLGVNLLNSGGAYVDSQSPPAMITDSQIQSYISGLLSAGKLPINSNTIYGVFFPSGVSVQLSPGTNSCTQFCAYHGGYSYNGHTILYAVFPYPDCSGCNIGGAVADMLTMFVAHETRETVTDAYNSWRDSSGYEADDKCAWSNLYRTSNGNFFVQPEYSNGGTATASGFTATYPGPGCIVPNASSGPLSITGPAALPAGTVGVAYTPTTVTATGGTGPYTWSATGLPAGLTIGSSTGTITGTPTSSGGFSPTVKVTDSTSTFVTQGYSVTINPALSISTTSLPGGTTGVAYTSTTVTATGGTGSYTWSATGLPPGLSIGPATGTVAGTPTAAGTYSPTVKVTDSASATATRGYSVTISPGPDFSISVTSSTTQTVNPGAPASYTVTIGALNGFGGTVSFGVTGQPAGTTPGFLPLTVTGSGPTTLTIPTSTSTTAGTYTLTITGTSGALQHTTTATLVVNLVGTISLTPNPTSLTISRGSSNTTSIGIARTGNFTGGVSLSASGLPSRASASFSPNPATGGSSNMKISVNRKTPTGTYTVTVKGTGTGVSAATTTVGLKVQ